MQGNGRFRPEEVAEFGRRAGRGVGDVLKRNLKFILFAGVGLIAATTTYYQVEPDQVGVVTQFGAYARTSEPGPHFKIPFGVERVRKVPVQRQLKQEFGFRTVDADVRTEYASPEEAQAEALMLTGDLNVATVEWIVQYQIKDPYLFLFKVRNVTPTLRDLSEATMRQVVGDRGVSEVLTIGREAIADEAKLALQDLCDQYEMGIEILQLVLQDVNPPEPVKPSFNEVNQAIQERERAINEAWAAYNRVIPEAKGKAEQAIQSSEGYATERVNRAQGEAQRFLQVLAEYRKAPAVTRSRLYLESLGRVLPNAGPKIIVDDQLKGLVPLLQLGLGLGAAPAAKGATP